MDWNYIAYVEDDIIKIRAVKEDGEEIGYLDTRMDSGSLDILEIGVIEQFRRRGIASAMLDQLIQINENELMLPVTIYYCLDEDTEIFHEMVESRYNFQLMENGTEYIIPVKQALQGKLAQRILAGNQPEGNCIDNLLNQQIRTIIEKVQDYNFPVQDTTEDFKNYYNSELSSACVTADGEVQSVLLATVEEDEIHIETVCNFTDKTEPLIEIFSHLCKELQNYTDKTLTVLSVNDESQKLCDYFFAENEEVVKKNKVIAGIYVRNIANDFIAED